MAKRKKPPHIRQKDWDDVDSPPLTDKMLNTMRPMRDVFPDLVEYSLRRKRGRPPKTACKEKLTLRLDADIVEWLQEKGPGYQTRLNAILRDVMESK